MQGLISAAYITYHNYCSVQGVKLMPCTCRSHCSARVKLVQCILSYSLIYAKKEYKPHLLSVSQHLLFTINCINSTSNVFVVLFLLLFLLMICVLTGTVVGKDESSCPSLDASDFLSNLKVSSQNSNVTFNTLWVHLIEWSTWWETARTQIYSVKKKNIHRSNLGFHPMVY